MGNLIQPHKWDARGESLWSVMSKLAAENAMSGAELRRCFYLAKESPTYGSHKMRSCLTLDGIDKTTIMANTNLSEEHLRWTVPSAFVTGQGNFSTTLRYCLDCLNEGFHSALFQIEAYAYCPWHEMVLKTGCPICDHPIDYEVGKLMAESPYRCRCEPSRPDPSYFGNEPTVSRARVIDTTKTLVSQVRYIETQLGGSGKARIRLLTGDPVRHDQIPTLIRRSRVGRTPNSILALNDTPSLSPNTGAADYRVVLGRSKDRVLQLRALRSAWREDTTRRKSKFFNDRLLPDFTQAVTEAITVIRQRYLAKHVTCWCLSTQTTQYQFAMGLSCVWRSAFEYWREKNKLIVGRTPCDEAFDTNWQLREWISIVDRLLVESNRSWSTLRDPDVVMKLCRRLTVDSLVRHYALLVKRLVDYIAFSPEAQLLCGPGDLESLIDTENQTATYLLKLSPQRSAVTLSVDDDQVNLVKMAAIAAETDHSLSHLRCAIND